MSSTIYKSNYQTVIEELNRFYVWKPIFKRIVYEDGWELHHYIIFDNGKIKSYYYDPDLDYDCDNNYDGFLDDIEEF